MLGHGRLAEITSEMSNLSIHDFARGPPLLDGAGKIGREDVSKVRSYWRVTAIVPSLRSVASICPYTL